MSMFKLFDVYEVTGLGLVLVGAIEESSLRIGMKAELESRIIKIKTIEAHHEQLKEAKQGDKVGIAVSVSGETLPQEKRGVLYALFGAKASPAKEFLMKYRGRSIEFV